MKYWYIVSADNVKPHFCSSYFLAQFVAENLRQRGLDDKLLIATWDTGPDKIPTYRLDYGSMIPARHDGNSRGFDLSEDLYLLVKNQALGYVKNKVEQSDNSKYGGTFHKIHDNRKVLCLTNSQFETLRAYMGN